MITGVGIKLVTGELFCLPKPARHDDVHKLITVAGFKRSPDDIEGFIYDDTYIMNNKTHDREPCYVFLNRTASLEVAKHYNQLLSGHDDRYTELFSEDLW